MNVDPFAPQLLIDYDHFCRRFGHLDFGVFMALWHAADALMTAGLELGYEPHEVPDLLLASDHSSVPSFAAKGSSSMPP